MRTDNKLFHVLDNVQAYMYILDVDRRNIFAEGRLWVLSVLYTSNEQGR